MNDCHFMAKDKVIDEDTAVEFIIKKLRQKLRKTHSSRVLK